MSVEKNWKLYRKMVLPKDMNPLQLEYCKGTFYAAYNAAMIDLCVKPNSAEEMKEVVLGIVSEVKGYATENLDDLLDKMGTKAVLKA